MPTMSQLNSISLFSGAGGLDLGLDRVGFNILATVEIDFDCRSTLSENKFQLKNRLSSISNEDVSTFDPLTVLDAFGLKAGDLDLLAGGPPCQAFTTTGKRRGLFDERGSLVRHYLRILGTVLPKYFLMENVTGFLSAALQHRPLLERGIAERPMLDIEMKGSVLRWFLRELVELGYTVSWGVLDAVDFGVPQFRQRAFLIGTRMQTPVFLPLPTHFENHSNPKKLWRTLRDALVNLDEPDPLVQPLSKNKIKIFSKIPAGGNWRSLSPTMRMETMGMAFHAEGGKSGWWRRLAWDRPAPTILTMPDHSSTGLIHPDETRCLSARECARCQTFPDSWTFVGTSRSQYRQIGNAVPVELGAALGKQILRHMGGEYGEAPSAPVWRKASANQRLGTWGWITKDGIPTLLNRRADHIDLRGHVELASEHGKS